MKLVPILCALAVFAVTGCTKKSAAVTSSPRPVLRNHVNLPTGPLPPGTRTSYSSVPGPGNFIAMTFDDGPVPANTPRLLDMLRQRNIKATFFVVGNFAVRYPHIIRRIVAEGHEIANHTWTHSNLSRMSDEGVRSELRRSHDLALNVSGAAPRMFRPPGGAITARQKQWIMNEFGYPCIMWSVDPRDWEQPSRGGCKGQPAELTRRIVSQTKSGDIVLVHDLHASSVDAMPATLDGLLSRGFRFLTMSQLIGLNSARGPAPARVAVNRTLYSPGSF